MPRRVWFEGSLDEEAGGGVVDIGLLIIRMVAGPTVAGHDVRKLFALTDLYRRHVPAGPARP
jgi:hypothetical protein